MKRFFFAYRHTWLALIIGCIFIPTASARAELYVPEIALARIQQARDPEQLALFLEQVYQRALDNGIRNFTPYALLLVNQCVKALGKNDLERADIFSAYAQKFSSDLPPAHTARAAFHWHTNKLAFHRFVQAHAQAFFKALAHPAALSFMVSSNLMVLTGALFATFTILSVVFLIKYLTLLFHDVRSLTPRSVPSLVVWGAVIVVCLLPVFFGCTFFWVFVLCMALLFVYFTKTERIVLSCVLVLFALVQVCVVAAGTSIYMQQSELMRLLWKVNYGYCSNQDLQQLEELNRDVPDDEDILFSLGLAYKKRGTYLTSKKYYEHLTAMSPHSYKAHINLGNVCLALKQTKKAVQEYNKAVSLAPGSSAAAHFNLSRAYQEDFKFEDADRELMKAKEIEQKRINFYLTIYSENVNRLVIDEQISRMRLWQKGYGLFSRESRIGEELWNALFGGVPFSYGTVVVLCIVAVSFFVVSRDKMRIALRCRICGQPFCRRCQATLTEDVRCTQCVNFFKQQESPDRRIKEKTVSRITRHRTVSRIIETALALLFPGSCHVLKGYCIVGAVVLFVFSLLLLKTAAVVFLDAPWTFVISYKIPAAVSLSIVLAVLWFAAMRHGMQQKNKTMDEPQID